MAPARTLTLAGVTIPRFGLGTFELNDAPCAATVAAALHLGVRHIDTAERYQNERFVGEGLRASGVPREDVFVTSKVWFDHLDPPLFLAAVEASLLRLGLHQLDLCLIHWPNPNVPLRDTLDALAKVKRRGVARAVGVSNFPPGLLREAVARSPEPLAVNQVEYHPYLDQSPLRAVLAEAGMGLTAYCPLARGKVLRDPVIGAIAQRHGVSPAAVTLAWLLHQDNVLVVPKSRAPARIEDNLTALDVTLSAGEIAAISALATPRGRIIDPSFAPDWAA
ncbi:MAG: aldo/keto reductase [Pseudomonadota bacterium]